MPDDLCQDDILAWSARQAELLRQMVRGGRAKRFVPDALPENDVTTLEVLLPQSEQDRAP